MDNQTKKTPLIDLLRAVPLDARLVYEHSFFEHQMIPVGRLAAEAADEIAKLRAALEAWEMADGAWGRITQASLMDEARRLTAEARGEGK